VAVTFFSSSTIHLLPIDVPFAIRDQDVSPDADNS